MTSGFSPPRNVDPHRGGSATSALRPLMHRTLGRKALVATMHRTNGHWRAMNGSSGDGSDEKASSPFGMPSLVDCSILLKRSERRSGKAAQYRTVPSAVARLMFGPALCGLLFPATTRRYSCAWVWPKLLLLNIEPASTHWPRRRISVRQRPSGRSSSVQIW